MMSTAEICNKAGLTYDGFTIGLPEEYYMENYPKESLMDKLNADLDRELKKIQILSDTKVESAFVKKCLKRLWL